MASFKDTKGRVWTPRITLRTLARLESALGVKLLSGADAAKMKEVLFGSVDNFLTALWISIEDQGVTRDDLGDALEGSTTAAAVDALGKAMRDFWPQAGDPGLRPTPGPETNGSGPQSSP